MVFQGLSRAISRTPNISAALDYAAKDADFSVVEGLNAPLVTALLDARSAGGFPPIVLAVTATNREAEKLTAALESLLPHALLCDFPAWETLPHERLSPSTEIVGRRFEALRQMRDWDGEKPLVLITSVRGALQPIADNLGEVDPITLHVGGRGYDLAVISSQLVDLAYVRVDMVTRRGEFAVRGGILDVFPPVADHPVRVDFFGNEVDTIRAFSVADQRSLDAAIPAIALPPSRELLLTAAVRQRAREMEHEFPGLTQMLSKIGEGIAVEGMESLTPALVDRLVPITHYLPPGAAVALLSPERIATRAINLTETNREFLDAAWNAASSGAQAPIDLSAGDFLTITELRDAFSRSATLGSAWWTFSAFQHGPDASEPLPEELDLDEILSIRINARAVPSFAGNLDGAVDHVESLLTEGWAVVVAAEGHGLVERAAQVLAERNLAARMVAELPEELEPAVAYLVQASVEAGFELEEAKLAVISEAEFYGRAAGYDSRLPRKLASRRKNVVDPLKLEAGDIVVHETHGIGKFLELVQREVSSGGRNPVKTTREYLVIEYAPSKRGYPGDKLYVPTDQLDQLTRYVGGEAPALSKMGGSDWGQAKSKARKAVRDIAVELVKLYSARMASKGFSFSPDTPWQRELEEAFPFMETPDQLTTIDEVKADMERAIPMDRLISGDVGFGKTEIAVRAAFKAVQDGKQVAILVPTTLLVKQHFETFQERFAGFPVHLRALSRFQTDKEAKETMAGMADGTVDVVIGTHRLLAKGVEFKDLGLVIIDEEQRFGVEHKDSLKKLKTNVDILAMSATPIPRTLEMAVTGIREMSTLATPPEDRQPILTFVGPFSQKQAAAAIRREILREGQIFFVHNRVSSINRVAAQIAELVPEARVGVAHGQLSEHQLEQVIIDFWERKFDVLVSTTIIETGLDIANANTLIVDRADKYGLSQLHQLRGRVGRGRERAYAYLFYDENMPLSETAHDRLGALAANNELGSGIQIALKDLEIRGAGNLLGGEQSGHIAGVGFDLYLRMIGEAVSAFRGDVVEGQTELRLELPVDARIPDDYVNSERLRLEAYQKLSVASAPLSRDEQIDQVLEELTDRYGEPPAQVHNLIAVSRLRRRAHKSSLSEVVVMGSNLRITPADLLDSLQVRLARMYPGAKYVPAARVITVPLPENTDLITWTGSLLDAIFPLPAKAEEPSVASGSDEPAP
jgi:transcription-repair coupling factor (superfamily II helicase)